jgi:hypothetical protein
MQWEYRIEELRFGLHLSDIEAQLNELGDGGWEAVSALPVTGNRPNVVFVLFKKPRTK